MNYLMDRAPANTTKAGGIAILGDPANGSRVRGHEITCRRRQESRRRHRCESFPRSVAGRSQS